MEWKKPGWMEGRKKREGAEGLMSSGRGTKVGEGERSGEAREKGAVRREKGKKKAWGQGPRGGYRWEEAQQARQR